MLPGDLLTTAQTADLLHKSVATVNRMASDGRLVAWLAPGGKGARWYRKADVEALRATQTPEDAA